MKWDTSHETRILDAKFVAGATSEKNLLPPALAEVAFVGRSNVGKSSLLNSMMARKNLARTSGTPGCTRQINIFEVQTQEGLCVHFVDLPGYGYAARSKAEKAVWSTMIENYLRTRVTLRAVVLLVDVRRGIEEDDAGFLEFMHMPREAEAAPPRVFVVATKLDRLNLAARKPALEAIKKKNKHVLEYSAKTSEGREPLWSAIRHAIL